MDEKVLHEFVERAARQGWRELQLPGEEITSLQAADIALLKNLRAFYLQENQLRSLPDEIGQLRNLLRLYLCKNQLSSLPATIGKLKNLTTLNLSKNQLSSLPAEIGQLKNLTRLYLAVNQLMDISGLMDLTKLKLLDLRRNRLSKLPREILDLGMEIRWELSRNKDGIFLADNPFDDPPIEIVKQGTEAVRNYFESIESEEISHVYEAKLLIVGDGDVGKTCLMKRLMEPDKAINEKELSTDRY